MILQNMWSMKQAIDKVLLIKPMYYGSHYDSKWLPTGIAYIAEALHNAGIESKIIDMGLGYRLKDVSRAINEFDPGLIGISMMSFGYTHTYRMIRLIKKSYPHIPIVVGGPHMSTLRDQVLKDCSDIDFGIIREGEETIVELCRKDKPLSEIKGLMSRGSTGDIVYTGDRSFIEDLDKNGFPKYAAVELKKYPRFVNIVTSRGCPYQCIYCPVNLAIGKNFRMRSAESVVAELRYWYDKGYWEFGIADDNFTIIRKRVIDICEEIKKQGLTGLRISCGNGLRADCVDRELLERMKEAGFYSIAFGVEGGNDKVLNTLRKGETIEAIERAINDSCKLGYKVTLFFLLGSPGEVRADVEDSVRLATKYPVSDVRFYNLIPFPNTELYEWVKNNNYFRKDPIRFISEASHWVNDPIFETPELPMRERKKLYKWANAMARRHIFNVNREERLHETQKYFNRFGLPEAISSILAKMYWNISVRKFLVEPLKEIVTNGKSWLYG